MKNKNNPQGLVSQDWPKGETARIAWIAEAPGDEEVQRGRPLVGPSGKVFDAMMRTANLERSDFFVGNVFRHQLPDNDVKNWCAPAPEARKWGCYDLPPIGRLGYLRPEYLFHLVNLIDDLEKVKPNIIVPMGGTALWAFTGIDAISKARGATSQASWLMPGVKILPIYHPAFVLRQWKFFHVCVSDMAKAAAQSKSPEFKTPKNSLWVEPSLADFRKFKAKYLDGAPRISVDIETGWHQITCIGFAPDKKRAICIPFVDFRNPDNSYWRTAAEEVEAWTLVAEILDGPAEKLGQNFPYDTYWLLEKLGMKIRNYRHDTRLLHHALYPEMPKSLGFMGASYTEAVPWKLLRYKKGEKRDD